MKLFTSIFAILKLLNMHLKLFPVLVLCIYALSACNNSAGPAVFCDTACVTDTLKFVNKQHKLEPYVYISVKNCFPDTVTWSYSGMGINRKLAFSDMSSAKVYLNKNFIRCVITDTSSAWVLFNNCSNGRGYFLKIPFDKKKNVIMRGSAINSFDPKFSVADGLMAYTDKGNIFVEEMATGKKAMMTFGRTTDMDYDVMHEVLDSVNITANKIWAKVKFEKDWQTVEKNITLQ